MDFSHFYTRNLYGRVRDAWNRPIASAPGAFMDVVDRYSDDYNLTFKLVIHLVKCNCKYFIAGKVDDHLFGGIDRNCYFV